MMHLKSLSFVFIFANSADSDEMLHVFANWVFTACQLVSRININIVDGDINGNNV